MAHLGNTIINGILRVIGGANIDTINGVTVGSSPKFTDTTYESKTAASGGTDVSLVTTGEKYTWNNKSNHPTATYYGECASDADTVAKVVTVADTTFSLQIGTIVGVRFTNTNSATSVTLNVNSTGDYPIWYSNAEYTASSAYITGYANATTCYMFNGTHWVWIYGYKLDGNTNTIPSAYCDTAKGTAAKEASCSGYYLLANSYIHVIITTTNTSASALTLNINGKGAKPIYINGTASSATNYSLTRGSYIVYYNGTNYYFRTDGKLTGAGLIDINGNTTKYFKGDGTLDTPTNTTYTFANGTNGFTVTPSGGSAQTVTVTPSIANNVTGSGTSGYLTKFNGANTVTNGPALGSDTTKFLRNDGTWQVPSYPEKLLTEGSITILANSSSGVGYSGASGLPDNPVFTVVTDTDYDIVESISWISNIHMFTMNVYNPLDTSLTVNYKVYYKTI